jgi:hypothetical protein
MDHDKKFSELKKFSEPGHIYGTGALSKRSSVQRIPPSAAPEKKIFAPDTAVPEAPKRQRIGIKQSVELSCRPDHRSCRVCRCFDDDGDEVCSVEYMCWAYPAKMGKNQGKVCYYCHRVWQARYDGTYTITMVITKMGLEKQFADEVLEYRRLAVTQMVANGSREPRVDWKAMEQKLRLQDFSRLEIAGPVDEIWEEKDYSDEYGDWKTNGKGHSKGCLQGICGILVPAKRVHKITHTRGQQALLDRVVDNGNFMIGENQMEAKFEGLCNGALKRPESTGMTMDMMLKLGRRATHDESPASDRLETPSRGSGKRTPQSLDEDEALASSSGLFAKSWTPTESSKAPRKMMALEGGEKPKARDAGGALRQTKSSGSGAARATPAVPAADAGGDVAKKRGRPPRANFLDTCEEILGKVAVSEPDSVFFLKRVTAGRRLIERTLKDTEGHAATLPEGPELVQFRVVIKRMQASHDVLKAWAKSEAFTAEVRSEFSRAVHFLGIAPTAETPFPRFLTDLALEDDALTTDNVASFLKIISRDNLTLHGFSSPLAVQEQQLRLIARKTISLSKDESLETGPSLTQFYKGLHSWDSSGFTDEMRKELADIIRLLNPNKEEITQFSASLASLLARSTQLMEALQAWPTSRQFIAAGTLFVKTYVAAKETIGQVEQTFSRLGEKFESLKETEPWAVGKGRDVADHVVALSGLLAGCDETSLELFEDSSGAKAVELFSAIFEEAQAEFARASSESFLKVIINVDLQIFGSAVPNAALPIDCDSNTVKEYHADSVCLPEALLKVTHATLKLPVAKPDAVSFFKNTIASANGQTAFLTHCCMPSAEKLDDMAILKMCAAIDVDSNVLAFLNSKIADFSSKMSGSTFAMSLKAIASRIGHSELDAFTQTLSKLRLDEIAGHDFSDLKTLFTLMKDLPADDVFEKQMDAVLAARPFDTAMANQLAFIRSVSPYIQAFAGYLGWHSEVDWSSIESRKLTPTVSALVLDVRKASARFGTFVAGAKRTLNITALKFEASGGLLATLIHTLTALDNIPYEALYQTLHTGIEKTMRISYESWQADMKSLSEVIIENCPQWESHGKDLLTAKANTKPSIDACRKALIHNPQYTLLSNEIVPALATLKENIQKIQHDKNGAIIDASVLKTCGDAIKNGICAISLAYILYQVTVTIPQAKGPKFVIAAATKLKAEVKDRLKYLPTYVKEYLDELESPSLAAAAAQVGVVA